MSPLSIWRLFNNRIYRIWSCFRNSASKRLHFENNKYFVVNLLRYFFFRKGCFRNPTLNRNTFEEDLHFNFFHTIQPSHERCLHLADCMILRGPFMKTILAISKFHNFSPKGSVLSHDFLIKLLINSSRRLSLTATSIRYYTNLLNSSSLYSFLCIWCIIDEHIEKTANAVTSFKNTKQFQIKKLFIDIFIFPKNIWVLSSYQFLMFQNSFQVYSAETIYSVESVET